MSLFLYLYSISLSIMYVSTKNELESTKHLLNEALNALEKCSWNSNRNDAAEEVLTKAGRRVLVEQ
jgi:hypothetical protein